jgi:hypothetical protein
LSTGHFDFELEADFDDLPAEDFLYNRSGPWPQPSANHPLGTVPGVLHLPLSETIDWWMKVGSRYLKDLVFYTPVSIIKALSYGGLKNMSDEKFADYYLNTCYAKYLTNELSVEIIKLFKDFLKEGSEYLLVDFSAMSLLKAVEGLTCEKSITLFEVKNQKILPVAINLKNYIVEPKDGDLWALAKYIVMQGASVHINVAEHPKLHFPMDAINAITKTALPTNHILFQLLIPHLEVTLKLNYQVLNNPTSLLENKWWMPYAPFPATSDSLRDLMVVGYCGIKGNPAYKRYSYPMNGPRKVFSDFGTFHEQYYKAYYSFAERILAEIPAYDKLVTQWANYIHQMMPSFPSGVDIWKGDNFAKAVGVLLWDLSLGHATDHRTYSEIPVYHNPMRLRVASPAFKNPDFKLDRKKAATVLDQARWILASRLFYQTWNVTNLMDINYGFNLPSLQAAVRSFKAQLKLIEKTLPTKNYLPVDEIPASIQY